MLKLPLKDASPSVYATNFAFRVVGLIERAPIYEIRGKTSTREDRDKRK